MAGYSFNAASGNRQSTYGSGLGNIYQYGAAMPYGPYSGLQRPGAGSGASTATASSGPTAAAESWLNDVLSGKNLPFSPQQQAAQLTQQTDMNAAAESARGGQLDAMAAAGGASANDPSFQGAKAANFARRQTDNSKAAGAITSQANSANFGAQMQAAGQLNQNQMSREGFNRQASNQAMGFMPWNQGGGQSSGQSSTSWLGLYPYAGAPR